jgi:hypothetical protein
MESDNSDRFSLLRKQPMTSWDGVMAHDHVHDERHSHCTLSGFFTTFSVAVQPCR